MKGTGCKQTLTEVVKPVKLCQTSNLGLSDMATISRQAGQAVQAGNEGDVSVLDLPGRMKLLTCALVLTGRAKESRCLVVCPAANSHSLA
jgi:hypothetical protein